MKELDRTIVRGRARVVRRTALAVLLAVTAVILLAPAVEAATLPSILTQDAKHPFRVRPASIDYTGDATGFIGGTDGTSVRNLGHIQWPVYTSRQAVGRGLVWLNDCEPDCAEGTFSSTPVSLHAFSPGGGHFRRLTLKYTYQGKAFTDRRVAHRLPFGTHAWVWDIARG
jgi:hypothetical protein